ncbi:MAG: hypothetical protein IJJ89_02210, partial [Eubacterium sp.]|nr:hypothetical protein [Eubacterium sp.]
GPQIVTLICDDAIYDDVPVKGEVKAMVSGIYLVSVKSVRKQKNQQPVVEELDKKGRPKKKKLTFREKMRKQQAQYQQQLKADIENKKTKEQLKADKAKEKKERERAKKITD